MKIALPRRINAQIALLLLVCVALFHAAVTSILLFFFSRTRGSTQCNGEHDAERPYRAEYHACSRPRATRRVLNKFLPSSIFRFRRQRKQSRSRCPISVYSIAVSR